jgi:hypothetical protein
MQTLQEDSVQNQASQIEPRRKVGVDIVRSADLGRRFYRGPQKRQPFVVPQRDEDWTRRVARVLR